MFYDMSILARVFLVLIFASVCRAETSSEASEESYWEFGAGFGAVRFEQYPASDQFTFLALPAPTFQYRGKIIRADDRDGAHIYLFKSSTLSLELSGEGNPALDSSNNNAREGMADLPWMGALGPQLVYRGIENLDLAFGIYQAITTDFKDIRTAGNIFDIRGTYQLDFDLSPSFLFKNGGTSSARFTLSLKSGTQEINALYFQVDPQYATSERPAFHADAGFQSYNVSYFQSFKTGRFSLYVGTSLSNYDLSVNKNSPLHKSDHNLTMLVGLNYILTESSRPAVPRDETSGVINSIQRNRQLRDSF